MTEKVLIVSTPDDVLDDGFRILFVDLNEEQGSIISQAISNITINQTLIAYTWKYGDPTDWLLDKKHKSDLIFFNAESQNDTITGYMAAQKNSYYFGTLRDLSGVNKSAVYDASQCKEILERQINYE
jgi:hypothetical protein